MLPVARFIAALAFLSAPALEAVATELGAVKADGTPIHESASRKAGKVGIVDRMAPLDILEKGKDWVRVRDRISGAEGWVRRSAVYLSGDPLSSLADPREDRTCKFKPPVTLKVSGDRFYCDEGILGKGYESCTLSLTVEATSACKNAMQVFPDCTADMKARFAKSPIEKTVSETGKGHFVVEGGFGYGYVEILFSKPFSIDAWVSAKVLDAKCRADSFAY